MSSLDNANEFLNEAAELAHCVEKTKDSVTMELYFFGMYGRQQLWSDALRTIVRGESKLKRLLEPAFVNGLAKGDWSELSDRFANLRMSMGASPRNAAAKSPNVVKRLGNDGIGIGY